MKHNKNIRVRITESQMKKLIDTLLIEEDKRKTKSSLIRELLDRYLGNTDDSSNKKSKNQLK